MNFELVSLHTASSGNSISNGHGGNGIGARLAAVELGILASAFSSMGLHTTVD